MTQDTTVREDVAECDSRDRRAERYDARETLWRESTLDRVKQCGFLPIMTGGVGVKASGAAGRGRCAGFSGLSTCGSTWVCTVCSAKIAATRQAEIAEAVRRWQAQGHTVAMLTQTMRHKNGQGLGMLWDACSYAWGASTSGSAWQSEKDRYGVRGWLRIVEVTHGDNGWHVHVHALLFLDANSRWAPEDLGPLMFQRWRRALMRKGLEAPEANLGGLDFKVLGGDAAVLSEYFTKSVYRYDEDSADDLALEIARGDLKDARHGNRTPFRILADIVKNGLVEDLAIWHEWEQGSLNRRQRTWARGFREELLGDVEELTDDEIVEQEVGGDLLLVVTSVSWRELRTVRGHVATVLGLAESDDTGLNLRAWLRFHGYRWHEVTEWTELQATKALEKKRNAG